MTDEGGQRETSGALRVFGLMSGTSLDGIDVADVRIERRGGRLRHALLHFETVPLGAELRACLLAAQPPHRPSLSDAAELDIALGEALACAVQRCAERWGVDLRGVDVIGSHGVTVWHAPEIGATVQIGEPAVVTARTGVTCVADFRRADMAAGGQGAPLVPFVDWHLFGDSTEYRAALNLGGIANMTLLPAGSAQEDARAFDTGPGNMVIDACMHTITGGAESVDRGGATAARGTVAAKMLDELMDDPFVSKPPPKSTGRERYGAAYFVDVQRRGRELGIDGADLAATVTAFTACSIARQVPTSCERLIVSGGGVHNETLMSMLRADLESAGRGCAVESSAAHGVPPDAKEAVAFAMLAAEAIAGRVNHLPACTGSKEAVVLGKIVPGRNYVRLMGAVFRASSA